MSLRVLITRETAEPLQGLLVQGGVEVVHVPLVAISATGAPVPSVSPDVIVVTSAAVVRCVPDLSMLLPDAPVAAVGEATASALDIIGIRSTWVGTTGGGDLIEGLPDPQASLLYVGAVEPSKGVCDALSAHAGPVQRWGVYVNRAPDGAADALASAGLVDMVALTSPSAAQRYAALAQRYAPVVAIGATTAQAAREAGLDVVSQAEAPRVDALAAAILARQPEG